MDQDAETSADNELKKVAGFYQNWMKEIAKSKQRERKYRKLARETVDLYEAEEQDEHQFNILYSNTETLSPALYNRLPRPDIKPKDKKTKDVRVIEAAKLAKRIAEALLDMGHENDMTPDSVFKQAVTEGLVAGRGLSWMKYSAEVLYAAPAEGETQGKPEAVQSESVSMVELPWDRFLHGYAKKWANVPWVAAIWFMTKEELQKNFGEAVFAGTEFKPTVVDASDGYGEIDRDNSAKEYDRAKPDMACVYEIWDKNKREVVFLSDSLPDKILRHIPDPFKLVGFYPCPEPLTFLRKISGLVPVPLYKFYKDQAEELNDITYRIRKIIRTIKVRGAYDSSLEEGMRELLKLGDGGLAPIPNNALLALGNGQAANLANAIWYQPIKEPIMALQQLYQQREEVKQVIYEVTGISDILRGASQASETATAQNIKNQWGTLRLKRAQGLVAEFCRGNLRLLIELAVSKLSPDTIRKLTQTTLPAEQEKQLAKQQMAALQQQAMLSGQQPQLPPEIEQLLSIPSLEELLDLLKNDLYRCYAIDIETNSTVDAEATEDKQEFSELLNAISQYMNGIAPLIESGVMTMQAAGEILVSVVRRFRLGDEVEDQIRALGQQKKQPGAEDAKAAAEQQKMQLEMQKMQMDAQLDQAKAQTAIQLEQEKLQLEQQRMAMEREKLSMELQFLREKQAMELQKMQLQLDAARQQAMIRAAAPTARPGEAN